MGLRYAGFRFWYEIKKRIGLFKFIFQLNPPAKNFISLEEWRAKFKFWGITKEDKIIFSSNRVPDFKPYEDGYFRFFSAESIYLGKDYDWLTNPDSGCKYDIAQPWWKINDYSKEAGDIKFVWEKSRFAFLYDIIRNDKYTGIDRSQWVFDKIISWINENPVNFGPNYKCSQEISLRILNWTYALNYYRNSPNLTEGIFNEVMNSIYLQLNHVYSNINFSRIAVRNNHAITETLTLYIAGMYYSFFPGADKWKRKGKKWFEKEIEYQIYEDGTFLQYSMNYHRVVIQLLTWAYKSAHFMHDNFSKVVYDRAYKSLEFLYACQDQQTGWLPNYGQNDGALFFKFTNCDFRDYRPQLNTLHYLLTGEHLYGNGDWLEDFEWFNANQINTHTYKKIQLKKGWYSFPLGGYYVLRETEGLTFIRCGKHLNRPAQADNLHIDIWYNGANILFDGGTYKYNTEDVILKYFMGTSSHNTIMLDEYDQMLKGSRFIWYNWSQAIDAVVNETKSEFIFTGTISAFTYLNKHIKHHRKIVKLKGKSEWIITDFVNTKPENSKIVQHWNLTDNTQIESLNGFELKEDTGWKSDYYGLKKEARHLTISTNENTLKTKIKLQ